MSEKTLEKKCKDYAKSLGWLAYKFKSPSHRGLPDDLFINKVGSTVYVEFKNPNGKGVLSPLQAKTHTKMRGNNAPVYVCKDFEHFKRILGHHENDNW